MSNSLLAIASFNPVSLESPNAWVGHMPFAAWVIQEVSPKLFVELGTHSGNSYFSFCQSVLENGLPTKCYAVDTWQGDEHAGQYSADIFNKVNTHNQDHYAGFSRLLRMTFDEALSYFADDSIELLHIDGLHTYEAVAHDFETWLPKLAPGAVVMFHDTNVRERDFGVWKLWEELQARYPNDLEFIHSHGLGVLQIKNTANARQLDWLHTDLSEKQNLIAYFAALGNKQLLAFELNQKNQQIVTLNNGAVSRDNYINELNNGIINRDIQLANLGEDTENQDNCITDLNAGIANRDTEIANLNADAENQENFITGLNNGLKKQGAQIIALNNDLEMRDRRIANLNDDKTNQENRISELNSGLSEQNNQVANRDRTIAALISSKSWQITRPMRWAGRIIRGDLVSAADPFRKIVHSNEQQIGGADAKSLPIRRTHPAAIILPVYRGIEMTKRCIISAIPGIIAMPGACIIVINDASPDKGMQEMLAQLASQWPAIFFLLENEKNLGFVATVNRGLAYFPQHDAVLLNSDVVVPVDWLSRLIDEAYSKSNIGTVTPFSNNATICSFPYFCQENPTPLNLAVDVIDAVFKSSKLPCVTAPTGVGFCLYIRRTCLDEIGYLNEDKFGRGYGEENDLCQRALKKGWINILSPNIYAYHEGGVSFSSEKQGLVDNAMRVLDELHPSYRRDIQEFIQLDPLRASRIQRYIQLLGCATIPKVLVVTHALGGGVSQHLQEMDSYYGQRIVNILLTAGDKPDEIIIALGMSQQADRLAFNLATDYAEIIKLLKSIGITAVHFHHIISLDLNVLNLPNELNVPHIFTIHDFYYMHGNPTLTDANGKYFGHYDENAINRIHQLPDGLTNELLRLSFSKALESATHVIFPSRSTQEIFTAIYPKLKAIVTPHIEAQRDIFRVPSLFKEKDRYIISALGALCRDKGADLLEEIALLAKTSKAPIKVKLLGYAYRPLKNIETSGAYPSKELPDLIKKHNVDVIFFSARWPETYSYTLSYALDSGLPIIAPDIGAFPERLSGRSNTLIYNYNLPAQEVLWLIINFVKNLEMGYTPKAPKFTGGDYSAEFYESAYMEIMAGDTSGNNIDQAGYSINETTAHACINKRKTKKSTLPDLLLRLRMHPSTRWLSVAVPKRLRRQVFKAVNGSLVITH